MNTIDEILPKIEVFLSTTGMAKSTFGRKVASDGGLVDRLRGGADVHTRTARRISTFMEAHKNDDAAS